jgi:hypothetical protein
MSGRDGWPGREKSIDEPGRAEGVGAEGVGEGSTCVVEGRDLAWGILILSVDVVLYGA